MVTLPVIFREEPSQVSACSLSSSNFKASLSRVFHCVTMSSLISDRPAPVSIKMGIVEYLEANSRRSHALLHVNRIFAICRGPMARWAVHEHTVTVLAIDTRI